MNEHVFPSPGIKQGATLIQHFLGAEISYIFFVFLFSIFKFHLLQKFKNI